MSNRIASSNFEDYIKSKILNNAVDEKEDYTRIFYYGIVINNTDPKNANRVKIRIPFLDDNHYIGVSKEQGDRVLPWCLPFNRNFVQTPEVNSIVVVALMDPAIPYFGRLYFDSLTELTERDIFDPARLSPETGTYDNWDNAEKALNIQLGSKPQNPKELSAPDSVKYTLGIRGKGKNRLTMYQDSTLIIQNEGDSKMESLLRMTDNVKLEAANEMELLSKKGGKHYRPVFDEPLYEYLGEMNKLFKEIIIMLNSKPSTNVVTMTPNLPSTDAPKLITKLQSLYTKFSKLKKPGNGASKQIKIN